LATKTENIIKQGRTNPNNFWCDYKVYQLLEDNTLIFASGGIEDLEQTKLVKSFIKRNKKFYIPTNKNIFENE